MTTNCHFCNYNCESFEDLAKHILSHKDSHKKGLKWANAFLLKVNFLNQKQDKPDRIVLTDEEKEAKVNCQRELTGELTNLPIICPTCQLHSRTMLPTEYATEPYAWKNNKGEYYINCLNCRKH